MEISIDTLWEKYLKGGLKGTQDIYGVGFILIK